LDIVDTVTGAVATGSIATHSLSLPVLFRFWNIQGQLSETVR
jgi:hypothetical protein